MGRIIIGLSGPIGSGKSTVADIMVARHSFVKKPFAAYLKKMLMAIGLTERQLYRDQKEEPCDLLCGKTPRNVGTGMARIDPHRIVDAIVVARNRNILQK